MPICWICEEREANTGEHVFKHTILRDLYGDMPFEKGNRLVVRAEREHNNRNVESKKYIESTDSKHLKFTNSLCKDCNGSYSQAWDREFDHFLRYFLSNWRSSLNSSYVNLKLSNPGMTRKRTNYLYRYFCKLFGCLLFVNGREVPAEIRDAVRGLNYSNKFGVAAVFEEKLTVVKDPKEFLVNHDLVGVPSNELNYNWALGFGSLKICFWYCSPPEYHIGQPWYGKSKRMSMVKHV